MPDLTIETRVMCAQNTYWTCGVKDYIVSYGPTVYVNKGKATQEINWGSSQYDYFCDCKAFQYQPGYCKHIKEVMHKRCRWGGNLDQSQYVETCPKCHGPTEVIKVAV